MGHSAMLAGIVRLVRRPKLRIIGLLVFVDLFVLTVILISLSGSLAQYYERAEATSLNLNRQVSQSISSEIGSIDLILRTAIDERFGVRVSQSHINYVRRAHGLSRPKKRPV